MKYLLAALFTALMVAGCDRSNPSAVTADASSSVSTESALFSESTMFDAVVVTDTVPAWCDSAARDSFWRAHDRLHRWNDSLRQGRILEHLTERLGLTGEQADSIRAYAQRLTDALGSIRVQVRDSVITREEARALVTAAREEFMASVRSVLTDDQLALLDDWILHFWDRGMGRGPHGGPMGPGDHGRNGGFERGPGRH